MKAQLFKQGIPEPCLKCLNISYGCESKYKVSTYLLGRPFYHLILLAECGVVPYISTCCMSQPPGGTSGTAAGSARPPTAASIPSSAATADRATT